MDEMIRYIFGSLRCSETAMHTMAKTMRKQKAFNNSVTCLAIVSTISLLIHKHDLHCLNGQIETLKKEIKELKQAEGD